MLFTISYLVAIVAANLIISWAGPMASPFVAPTFIGLDLTTKDHLQHRWGFGWRLTALIAGGSLLTVVFSLGAWRIAVASFVAFLVAGLADALVFERLKRRGWAWAVNGSNVAGAVFDSVLFLWLAFGWPPNWGAVGLQVLAKIAGGAVWCWVLARVRK